MAAEAEDLAKASYGVTMLEVIGRMYVGQAQASLGSWFTGGIAAMQQKGQSIQTHFHAAKMALKLYQAQEAMTQLDRWAQEGVLKACVGNF